MCCLSDVLRKFTARFLQGKRHLFRRATKQIIHEILAENIKQVYL